MIHQVTRRSTRLAPLAVLLILTAGGFGWFSIETGTRPLMILTIGIVLALALDVGWGFRALSKPELDVSCPGDARVGEPMAVTIRLSGMSRPATLTMLSVPGTPPVQVNPPEAGVIDAVPLVPGRYPWAIFEISTWGPLGLNAWVRRAVVQLPQAVLVAPSFVPHDVSFPPTSGSRPGHSRGAGTQLDLVRSIREYEPGDSSHLIHWGATARTGQLMVRELDPCGAGKLMIVLALEADDLGAEMAAGRAGFLAQRAIAEGWSVRIVYRESLDTAEQVMPRLTGNRLPIRIVKRPASASRTVAPFVSSELEARRRLALADFGDPDLPGTGYPGLVRIVTSSGEDRWLT